MNKQVVTIEIGALPFGEDKHSKLIINSLLRKHPKPGRFGSIYLDDNALGKAIANWLFRFIPACLWEAIFEEMKRHKEL